LQVRLERRREKGRLPLGRLPGRPAAFVSQTARIGTIDQHQRARPFEVRNASEPLVAEARHAPGSPSGRRRAPRKNMATTGVRNAIDATPKRRNVTSTPSELELGL